MRRFVMAGLLASFVLFPLFAYTYMRGWKDGVAHYRRSDEFAMTLESMYRFGLIDGCTDDEICDAHGIPADEGGHR